MLSLTQRICGVLPAGVLILGDQRYGSLHFPDDFHEDENHAPFPQLLVSPMAVDHHMPEPEEPIPPIHRLPADLFGEVFKHYLDETRQGSFTTNMSSLRSTTFALFNPITLGHVCSYWRALALSMPTLWSSIAVIKPTTSQVPMIELWLERAVDCPLSLTIFQGYDKDPAPTQRSATMRILTLFMARMHQWKRIEFKFFDTAPYTQLLAIDPSVLGMLEDVELNLRYWDDGVADRIWKTIHSLPTLRRTTWDPHYLRRGYPSHSPWAQLTHIKLDNGPDLGLPALLETIRQCQELRALACEVRAHVQDGSFQAAPVALPNLRELRITVRGSRDPNPLLSHLTLPSLVSLTINHIFSSSAPRLSQYLPDLLVRSGCHLESLSLTDSQLKEDELLDVLGSPAMQSLSRVDLRLCQTSERTFRLLTRSEDGKAVLPHLKTLVLPTCRHPSDVVLPMIMSRLPQFQSIHMHCQCMLGKPATHKVAYLEWVQHLGHDFSFGMS